jgi:hypothetical protein
MKVAYFNVQFSGEEKHRVMNIVLKNEKNVIDNEEYNKQNDDYMYINYKNKFYKINRYDKTVIEKIEHAMNTNPFKHVPGLNWEGCFHIYNIDDRFTNKKYYQITRYHNNESIIILTNKIIDDLYSNVLEK